MDRDKPKESEWSEKYLESFKKALEAEASMMETEAEFKIQENIND